MSTALSDAPSQARTSVRRSAFDRMRPALDVATTLALVGMPLARWHGWTLAESILGLIAVAGVAARLGSPRPIGLRARVLDPVIFALWVVAFAATTFWSEPRRPSFAELEATESPPRFMRQLSTAGPLSILVGEGWYREIQGTDQATGLFVVDDGGRSLWLNATPLPAEGTIEAFADEIARADEAEESLRELERRSGIIDGFPLVERSYAVEEANELRLLVVLERDGHRIAGWGASPGLDSRAGIEAIRQVARTARACGDVRDDAPSLVETLPSSILEAVR